MGSHGGHDLEELQEEVKELRKDKKRLDFLQRLTNKMSYTGRVQLRKSFNGRGWRLHETSSYKYSSKSVRTAIDNFIEENGDE